MIPSVQSYPFFLIVLLTALAIGSIRKFVASRASKWARGKVMTVHGREWVEKNEEKVRREGRAQGRDRKRKGGSGVRGEG